MLYLLGLKYLNFKFRTWSFALIIDILMNNFYVILIILLFHLWYNVLENLKPWYTHSSDSSVFEPFDKYSESFNSCLTFHIFPWSCMYIRKRNNRHEFIFNHHIKLVHFLFKFLYAPIFLSNSIKFFCQVSLSRIYHLLRIQMLVMTI